MQDNFLAFFGHVAIDVTIRVDRLPTSGTVAVNHMEQNFGGTAGNFAMVAARLGYPFHLYSAVSNKTHSDYMKFLKDIKADTAHLVIDTEDMGPIGYAVTTGEEQIFYFYQGPMDKSLYDWIKPETLPYEYLHFGTGLPSDFLKFSKLAGRSKIVFDPGQEIAYRYDAESLEPLLTMSHLVILNQSEFERAASLLDVSTEEVIGMCKNLIVTRGKQGSTLFQSGKPLTFPSLAVENPYDTIGAGDAFRAGLYFGLSKRMTLEDSVVIATITSSQAIMKPMRDFNHDSQSIMGLFEKNRKKLSPK